MKNKSVPFILAVIMFVSGSVLVHHNLGKISICGFCGYGLCSAAVAVSICALAVIIVNYIEGKKGEGYERKI